MALNRRDFLNAAMSGMALSFSSVSLKAQQGAKLEGYIRTNWSQDPFSYGSYSYLAKGTSRKDSKVLAEPIRNKLFFAGEATHPKYNSTVHAAYESGLIAAKKVSRAGAKKIAVIGAGISGLATAHNLAGSGKDVTVYEGRDRLGGRIWTDQRLGLPLDLGASWIHGTSRNPIAKLADKLDLVRDTTDDSYLIRGENGRLIEEDDAPDWLEDIVSVQHSAGADLADINTRAYWHDDDYGGDEQTFKYGYETVLAALAGQYRVKLNSLVSSLKTNESNVDVGLSTGESTQFDAVVLTVPLGVLKKGNITFSPSLPEEKREVIANIGMGVLDKVYLKFDKPFWDKEVTWIATPENGLLPGEFNQWLNLYRYLGEPIIMAFNGGSNARALSALTDEQILEKALQTLDRAYPA